MKSASRLPGGGAELFTQTMASEFLPALRSCKTLLRAATAAMAVTEIMRQCGGTIRNSGSFLPVDMAYPRGQAWGTDSPTTPATSFSEDHPFQRPSASFRLDQRRLGTFPFGFPVNQEKKYPYKDRVICPSGRNSCKPPSKAAATTLPILPPPISPPGSIASASP